MQIMPDTGTWLASRMDIAGYAREMLFEPEFNVRMGTYYLAYLSDVFSGNPVMVAAAFHAGDNNVKRWALDRAPDGKTVTLDMIPTDDTRSYVRKVMDAYAIYYSEQVGEKGLLPAGLPSAAAYGGGAGD
jgi:soluble lytic murein transglycosylase